MSRGRILDVAIKESLVDVPPDQKNFYYYSTICVYLFTVIFALSINSSFMFAVIRGWKQFWQAGPGPRDESCIFQKPFYVLIIQVVIANLFAILVNLVSNVPVVSFLTTNATKAYVNSGLGHLFLDDISSEFYRASDVLGWLSDQLTQWLILAIAFHRLLVFIRPRKNTDVFSTCTFRLLLFFIWTVSILVTAFMTYSDCFFKFPYDPKKDTGMYQFQCNLSKVAKEEDWDMAISTRVSYAFFGQKILFPIVVFFCYLVIFIKLMMLRKTTHSHYGENVILRQGIFIFVMFQISTVIMFIAFTTELEKNTVFLIKRMVSTADMTAAALSPLFIILTSREVQDLLFCWRKKTVSPPATLPLPTWSISSRRMSTQYRRKGTI